MAVLTGNEDVRTRTSCVCLVFERAAIEAGRVQKSQAAVKVPTSVSVNGRTWSLTAALLHQSANTAFGHYYAYIFSDNGWACFRINDSAVQQISIAAALRDAATKVCALFFK
jgi:ubiquitin C-terminal hydrolase